MISLIDSVKKHCISLLSKSRCSKLEFYSLQHTLDVFNNVKRIAEYEGYKEKDIEPILIAALFHDTGVSLIYKGHEYVSASNAKAYLRSIDYPRHNIKIVLQCVLATEMPQNPKSLAEKIICDADLMHLGSSAFLEKNKLLRDEWDAQLNLKFTDKQWSALTLKFLDDHSFFTKYGIEVLQPEKEKNKLLFLKKVNY